MPLIETHDASGNLTSRRTEVWNYDYDSGESSITNVIWEDVEEIMLMTELPMEPVAPMWTQVAAQPPPTEWLQPDPTPVLTRMTVAPASINRQAGPSPVGICDILSIIPGLGLWMSPTCDIMSLNSILSSLAGYFKTFKPTRWAVYVRGRLFSVVGTEAANELMGAAKRAVRDTIRIRKSG